MKNNLNCLQIKTILELYAKKNLNKFLNKLVKEHLENCPDCMAEYLSIVEKNTSKLDDNIFEKNVFDNKQYIDFKKNLSAYIDNELNNDDNIKIKKFAILNPLARKELENMFSFKKFLHSSFEKTKDELKTDYSKTIVNKIKQNLRHERTLDPFNKLALLLILLLGFLVTCVISLLYFQ